MDYHPPAYDRPDFEGLTQLQKECRLAEEFERQHEEATREQLNRMVQDRGAAAGPSRPSATQGSPSSPTASEPLRDPSPPLSRSRALRKPLAADLRERFEQEMRKLGSEEERREWLSRRRTVRSFSSVVGSGLLVLAL